MIKESLINYDYLTQRREGAKKSSEELLKKSLRLCDFASEINKSYLP